jgi:hypothetical protein
MERWAEQELTSFNILCILHYTQIVTRRMTLILITTKQLVIFDLTKPFVTSPLAIDPTMLKYENFSETEPKIFQIEKIPRHSTEQANEKVFW